MAGKFNNKVLLFPLIVILLLSATYALTFTQETSGEWTNYGFDRFSTNAWNYPVSIFASIVEEGENFTYTDTVVSGGDFQPLAYDWDADGTVEVISQYLTTLNVYNPSTNSLVLESSTGVSGTMPVQGDCFAWSDDDGLNVADNDRFCVVNIGSELRTLYYEDNTVKEYASASIGVQNLISAISCHVSDDYPVPYCYAVTDDSKMVQYRADTDDALTNVTTGSTATTRKGKPVISDVDYDGNIEIMYAQSSTSGCRVSVEMFEVSNSTYAVTDDATYGGAWTFIDDVGGCGGTDGDYSEWFVYDLDGANDEEFCITTAYTDSTPTGRLTCLNTNTKTTYYNSDFDSVTVDPIAVLYGDVDGDAVGEVVVFYERTSNIKIRVYDCDSGTCVAKDSGYYTAISLNTEGVPVLMQVNDDAYFDIVYDQYVFYSNGSVFNETEKKNFTDNEHLVPVNFNADAQMDLVGQKLNSLSVYTDGTGGFPAVSTITLNTLQADSGFYNYYSGNTCTGTEVEFKALQCSGSFATTCTYLNSEITNEERIYTDCGGADDGVNGTLAGGNPSANCTFNTAGTYYVNLYMQDEDYLTDFSVFDTITMNVINGVAGSTCNLPANLISSPSAQTSAEETTDEDLELTGGLGQALLYFLFGLFMIGAGFVVGYNFTKSIVGGSVFGVIGMVIAVALGLINLWIVILIAFLMILPILLKMFYSSN